MINININTKYFSPSNPNNPYDNVGIMHNNGLDFVAKNMNLNLNSNKSAESLNLKVFSVVVKFMQQSRPSYQPCNDVIDFALKFRKNGNHLKNINRLVENLFTKRSISNEGMEKFTEFFDAINNNYDAIQLNNICIKYENKIVNNINLSKSEKEVILSSISVFKYSNFYWYHQFSNRSSAWYRLRPYDSLGVQEIKFSLTVHPLKPPRPIGPLPRPKLPEWVLDDIQGFMDGWDACGGNEGPEFQLPALACGIICGIVASALSILNE